MFNSLLIERRKSGWDSSKLLTDSNFILTMIAKTSAFTRLLLVGSIAILITMSGVANAQGSTLPKDCKTSATVEIKNAAGTVESKTGCSECNTGFYPTSDKLGCQACSALCDGCDAKTGVCTKCTAKAYLDTAGCIACGTGCDGCTKDGCSKCAKGYFLDSKTKACAVCNKDCDDCTSATTCTTCKASFHLKDGACTTQQPSSGVNPLLYILGGIILLAIIGGVAYFACANHQDGPTGSYNYNQTYGAGNTSYGQPQTYGTPAANPNVYGYSNQAQPAQGFFAPQAQPQPAGFRPQGSYGVNTGVGTQGGYVQMGQVGGIQRPNAGAQYGFR